MITAMEIELALRPLLPLSLHTHLPTLAHLLTEILNHNMTPTEAGSQIAVDSRCVPLLQALAGQQVVIGNQSLVFPVVTAAISKAADTTSATPPLYDSNGSATPAIDQRQGIFMSGGTINGTVVGINNGEINNYSFEISVAGAKLGDGEHTTITVREQVMRVLRPSRTFYDRTDILADLQLELQPGGGAWIYGEPGCGLSMLLRQASNLPGADALPNGAIHLDGALEPERYDEILRNLYVAYHESTAPIAIDPSSAKSFLSKRQALFVLDRLPLAHDELVDLSDTLRQGVVLIAADGPAPTALADISLQGLPRVDAIRLCAQIAQLDASQPEVTQLLDDICATLDDLPVPLVLFGRLLRAKVALPAQLAAVLHDLAGRSVHMARAIGEPLIARDASRSSGASEPLLLAAQLTLQGLNPAQRAVLAGLTQERRLDLAALTTSSQLTASAVRPALKKLIELGLVVGNNDTYQVSHYCLRRVLDQLLPVGDERKRLAAFFAAAAAIRAGDLTWLTEERSNLLAAIQTLLADGQAAEAGMLAKTLQPALVLGGHWSTWKIVIDLAEQAAQATGDTALHAWALHERGTQAGVLGDKAAAATNLREALRLRRRLGDHDGAGVSLHNIRYLKLLPLAAPHWLVRSLVGFTLATIVAATTWALTWPRAVADAAEITLGTAAAFDVLANDLGFMGRVDLASLQIETPPAHGAVTIDSATGLISYAPAAGFIGTDSFTYRVCDNLRRCASALVEVSAAKTRPSSQDDVISTDKDTPVLIDVLANDAAPNSALDRASVAIVTLPAHGRAIVDQPTGMIRYTPDHDFVGNDNFSYRVCDRQAACAESRVTVSIANKLPNAAHDSATTEQSQTVTIDVLANDRDIDGDLNRSSVKVVTPASNGQTAVDPQTGAIRYTPQQGFVGSDRFSYQVCDTQGGCATAQVSVTVTNPPPTVQPDQARTNQNTAVTIDVLANDSDPDGALDRSVLTIVAVPNNGRADVDQPAGAVIYTPNPGFIGEDQFAYRACDAQGACSEASVTVTVINRDPAPQDDQSETNQNVAIRIAVLGNDSDPDGELNAGSVSVVGGPSQGIAVVEGDTGAITYTPNQGFIGEDQLRYRVCDTQAGCAEAVVTVRVINQLPLLKDDAYTARPRQPTRLPVLDNDSDPDGTLDPGSVNVVQGTTNATVDIDPQTGTLLYTAKEGFTGSDSFSYEVCDNQKACASANVTVTVTNLPPDAQPDTARTLRNQPVIVEVLSNDTDEDGIDPGSVTIVLTPSTGLAVVEQQTGRIGYRPNRGFVGTESFSYEVCDVLKACSKANVTVTVERPVLTPQDDQASTLTHAPVSIDVLKNDGGQGVVLDPATVAIAPAPAHGEVSIDSGSGAITYTPGDVLDCSSLVACFKSPFVGSDSFRYKVCDTDGDCAEAGVTVTVENRAPAPKDDTGTLDVWVDFNDSTKVISTSEVQIDVLKNDSDADGQLNPASVRIIGDPAHGKAQVNPATGSILYTYTNQKFNDSDSFVYEVTDNLGKSSTATVRIIITARQSPG